MRAQERQLQQRVVRHVSPVCSSRHNRRQRLCRRRRRCWRSKLRRRRDSLRRLRARRHAPLARRRGRRVVADGGAAQHAAHGGARAYKVRPFCSRYDFAAGRFATTRSSSRRRRRRRCRKRGCSRHLSRSERCRLGTPSRRRCAASPPDPHPARCCVRNVIVASACCPSRRTSLPARTLERRFAWPAARCARSRSMALYDSSLCSAAPCARLAVHPGAGQRSQETAMLGRSVALVSANRRAQAWQQLCCAASQDHTRPRRTGCRQMQHQGTTVTRRMAARGRECGRPASAMVRCGAAADSVRRAPRTVMVSAGTRSQAAQRSSTEVAVVASLGLMYSPSSGEVIWQSMPWNSKGWLAENRSAGGGMRRRRTPLAGASSACAASPAGQSGASSAGDGARDGGATQRAPRPKPVRTARSAEAALVAMPRAAAARPPRGSRAREAALRVTRALSGACRRAVIIRSADEREQARSSSASQVQCASSLSLRLCKRRRR